MPENLPTEVVEAIRNGDGDAKALQLVLEKGAELGGGHMGSVRRFKLSRGENKAPLYLAYKTFDSHSQPTQHIQDAMAVHQRLMSLPHGREYTVPTLRYTERGLLMTDLTEGGTKLVMSTNDLREDILRQTQQLTQRDPDFAQNVRDTFDIIDETWQEDFKQRVELIAREISSAHIRIKGDSTFFVLATDGSYRLVITDLDNVEIYDDWSEGSLYQHNRAKLTDLIPFISSLAMNITSHLS